MPVTINSFGTVDLQATVADLDHLFTSLATVQADLDRRMMQIEKALSINPATSDVAVVEPVEVECVPAPEEAE